jgi:hypothetical protein
MPALDIKKNIQLSPISKQQRESLKEMNLAY